MFPQEENLVLCEKLLITLRTVTFVGISKC